MTLETFFEKFDLFADAPDAVAKMRRLILQLAVQGRLVPQRSSEDPATDLIERAISARKALVVQGIVRNESADLTFLEDDHSALPAGWLRCPLRVYVAVIMGQSPPSTAYNQLGEGLPFYQGKAQFGDLHPTPMHWCTEPNKVGEPGDIVISVRAPVGPTNTLSGRSCIGRGLAALRGLAGEQKYLLYVLRAHERAIAALGVGSTFAAISKSDLDNFLIPVPPLDEQKRIVAKVDELMALCDRLEAQQQEREARHAAIARASLARFADAPTPPNLNFLFHCSYSIKPADLRKSILTLAVQGELVRQDPSDVPAEELLNQLQVERRRFSQAHKFHPSIGLPIDLSSVPFRIPTNWKWCRLSSIFNAVTDGDHLPPPKSTEGIAFLTIGNISSGRLDFEGSRFVPESYYRGLADFRRPARGDVLYTVVGATYGRPVLVDSDRPFCVQRHVAILKPAHCIESGFVMGLLKSGLAYDQATASTTGTAQPTIPLGSLRNFLVPLPPLAEQGRIVAKVSQLMVLVDRLEAQLAASTTAATSLLDAIVAELTTQKSPMRASLANETLTPSGA